MLAGFFVLRLEEQGQLCYNKVYCAKAIAVTIQMGWCGYDRAGKFIF